MIKAETLESGLVRTYSDTGHRLMQGKPGLCIRIILWG